MVCSIDPDLLLTDLSGCFHKDDELRLQSLASYATLNGGTLIGGRLLTLIHGFEPIQVALSALNPSPIQDHSWPNVASL